MRAARLDCAARVMSGAAAPLPKHARYAPEYRRFGFFWGLGLEHETYITTSQTRRVKEFSPATMRPERYSVSYYKNYQLDPLKPALRSYLDLCGGTITVPVLMNCHSFTHCDIYGEHRTTYEKSPKPNPKYSGQTMWEWMAALSPWLAAEKDRVFMWDGDTVEFMTQRFYCATVDSALRELADGHRRFLEEVNRMPRRGVLTAYGPLQLSPRNEPFATHLTNPRCVSMFNNGTIHINVTLPTRLGWDRRPLRWRTFVNRHRRLARLVQWWEPIWIAAYGAGDPLCTVSRTAAGSQRCAVSRYIGVGTYDTEAMPVGKILQIPRTTSLPWYDWLREQTIYAQLDMIGMDLNFNKHWAHGLELRFFEQMPAAELRTVLTDVVMLMDCALAGRDIPDPRTDIRWQRAAGEGILYGRDWRVPPEYVEAVCTAMGCSVDRSQKEPVAVPAALSILRAAAARWCGFCWRHMVTEEPLGCCVWAL